MSTEHDENYDFIDIKASIKSLLFAAGSGCTDRQLHSDYFSETGAKLDDELRNRLGMTFVQFLHKISDVCRVTQMGGEVIVHRISDEKLAHLDQLKKGEKSKKRKKKKAALTIRPGTAYYHT